MKHGTNVFQSDRHRLKSCCTLKRKLLLIYNKKFTVHIIIAQKEIAREISLVQ